MGNRHYKTLGWKDRLRIEQMLREGHKVQDIADALRVHNSTIYREIKRGMTRQITSSYDLIDVYCADTGQRWCDEHKAVRGPGLKIGNDYALAQFLEDKMLNEHYSPAAALGAIQEEGRTFSVRISEWTLYSYIAKGVFLHLTSKDLPNGGRKKTPYHKVREAKLPRGTSIEQRPAEILTREEPGDWEMDSVVSARGSAKRLIVMTERVTRAELIFLAPDGTTGSVIRTLNSLERKIGTDNFRKVFRTITVDNGSEFADCVGMERSCLRAGKRTSIYYCHPYSSYERGSNENCNRLIRRWLPKRTNFKNLTRKTIRAIQDWINNYPREILGFRSAGRLFRSYLEMTGLELAISVV